MTTAKYSRTDTKGKLYVDCSEREPGYDPRECSDSFKPERDCVHYRHSGCEGSWRCGLRDHVIAACDPKTVIGCPFQNATGERPLPAGEKS
jgi:hypothetical protein